MEDCTVGMVLRSKSKQEYANKEYSPCTVLKMVKIQPFNSRDTNKDVLILNREVKKMWRIITA